MKWKPKKSGKNIEIKYTGDKSLVYAKDLKPYIGLYYIQNGNLYTYSEEGQGPAFRLVNKITDSMIVKYANAKTLPDFNAPSPTESVSVPTEKDYKKGYYQRYFCKKVNDKDGIIIEITKAMSEKLKQSQETINLYKVCEMRWKLTGPRYDTVAGGAAPGFLETFTKISGAGQMPNIVYGVHSTNKRTTKKINKECMNGMISKIGGAYTQFGKIEAAAPFVTQDEDNNDNGGDAGWNDGIIPPPPSPPVNDGDGNGNGVIHGGGGSGGGGGSNIPLTNMLLDLDPTQDVFNTSTSSAADGERIYKIQDQSVNSWDIIQLSTDSDLMPRYYTGSAADFNNKPWVDFNEANSPNPNQNEWLHVNGGASAFDVGEATIYMAYQTGEGSNAYEGIFTTADTFFLSDGWGIYANRPGPAYNSEKLTGFYDDDYATYVEGPAFSRYSDKIICFRWSASLAPYLKENGNAWLTGSGGTSSPTVYPRDPILGSFWSSYDASETLGWNGRIYRLLVYSEAHDDTTVDEIMSTLNTDFGGIF